MSTASDQLLRLLTLLPLASRPEGIAMDEAAAALEVDVDQVMADIQVLTDRAYYLPAGSTADVQVAFDGDRLRVSGTNAFTRPLRLTPGELLALSVALRVAGVGSARAEEILAAVEGQLAGRDVDGGEWAEDRAMYMAAQLPPISDASMEAPDDRLPRHVAEREDADGIHEAFSRAVLEQRRVVFGYLKPGAAVAEVRTLEPYRVLHGEGEWYAVGRDTEKDDLRLFRLDRVLGVQVGDAGFEVDPDFAVDQVVRDGQVVLLTEGAEPREVEVAYSPEVARWVAERWEGREAAGGAYVVRHAVYDRTWLMRTVMRYGGEAGVG